MRERKFLAMEYMRRYSYTKFGTYVCSAVAPQWATISYTL